MSLGPRRFSYRAAGYLLFWDLLLKLGRGSANPFKKTMK